MVREALYIKVRFLGCEALTEGPVHARLQFERSMIRAWFINDVTPCTRNGRGDRGGVEKPPTLHSLIGEPPISRLSVG